MKIRVEFICLGNICRSPMAEAIFLHKLAQQGISSLFSVNSSGTGASFHAGEKADPRTRRELDKHGISSQSRARQLQAQDLSGSGFAVVMDRQNQRDVQALIAQLSGPAMQVVMMRDFDPVAPGEDVPDPYYGGPEGFAAVYEMLDRSCDGLINSILRQYGYD